MALPGALLNVARPEAHKIEEKEVKQHPWARIIKDSCASRIKHAHNSINNPKYPIKKEKEPASDRVKFTIIGDRVTKEFIYCTHLINGLHKYRWKNVDAPEIRGVTTVDWPGVWNDLKIRYGGLTYCLTSSVAVLLNDKIIGGEKELKQLVESKYIYHLCLDYYNKSIAEFAKFIRSTGRPFAYMHISIDDKHAGTLIFMLYADQVPYTCENFLRLCKEKRGGYGGTPVHRIVKDGWIQCGGFGLKSSPLDCENFLIPHDKRGVLCMANDGRHVDCSTQFFVLLQPAPWMASKYVAFGQLIEGEDTLKKIESVPTWCESPTMNIVIYKCGIFNMVCHDIMINKGANAYISGHIEDLNVLGELLWNVLLERTFLEAQLREIARLKEDEGEGEGEELINEDTGMHATQRFIRKKDEIDKQIEKSQIDSRRPTSVVSADINNDFDVEEYEYEPEEDTYKHQSIHTPSLVVKPEIPYYIPLTDVPYPGEIDSDFNLRRFLKGDYCLESDLLKNGPKQTIYHQKVSFPSELYLMSESESVSEKSLDSNEQKEIRRYLKMHVDRVSFAGGVIRSIARGIAKFNIFEGLGSSTRKSELISDDELRRFRMASADSRSRDDRNKKVSLSLPSTQKESNTKIKRRQTGFVRPEDLEKIRIIHKSETDLSDEEFDESTLDIARKVRIAPSAMGVPTGPRPARRPTGFVRPQDVLDSDTQIQRQSVLTRLYEDVEVDIDNGPTLKDYRPVSEMHHKNNILLTYSPNSRIKSLKSDDNTRDKFRHSLTNENDSFEQVLNLQHGKKAARKISSDYVKTIDQIEHRLENSIRSIEFAKTRPAISVSEYQMKNKKYQENLNMMSTSQVKTVMKPAKDFDKRHSATGLRLPGDSPLYSMVNMK